METRDCECEKRRGLEEGDVNLCILVQILGQASEDRYMDILSNFAFVNGMQRGRAQRSATGRAALFARRKALR